MDQNLTSSPSTVLLTSDDSTVTMTMTAKMTPLDESTLPSGIDVWKKWLQDFVDSGSGSVSVQNDTYTVEIEEKPSINIVVVCVAAAVLVVPGLVGNALLMCISRRSELCSFSYSVYLKWTSVTDSLSLVTVYLPVALQIKDVTIYNSLMSTLPVCRVLKLFDTVPRRMSPWIYVAFSVDRFIAIVFPLKRKIYCTVRAARIACGLVFVVVMALEIPRIASTVTFTFKGRLICATMENNIFAWTCVHNVLHTVIPCLLLFALSGYSLLTIKQSLRERTAMSKGTSSSREGGDHGDSQQNDQQAEIAKLTRNLLSIPLFTAITHSPGAIASNYLVLSLSQITMSQSPMHRLILDLHPYFTILNSTSFACSFYLLIATSRAYRHITWNMMRCSHH
ncbi:uncharacterized protein LOC143275594 [Babylonia areolata]|uniref:uncharacterized protein LOC143275594 n=1 Tax=Babylonia areolata TaxID=304850 RepID=UPI003FD4D5DB